MVQIRSIRQNAIHAHITQFDEKLQKSHFHHRASCGFCIRWYVTYKLSYPDLVERMEECRMTLAHRTILRWVQPYIPMFEKKLRKTPRPVGHSCHGCLGDQKVTV